jgi:hypothetical protein
VKIFIFILLIGSQLFSFSAVKTVVNAKSIDLYRLPFETSQKRASYYPRGTILHVSACNRYGWCKVKNGYVKQHLLKFYNLKKFRYKNLPKHKVVKKQIKYPDELIDIDLYEPKKQEVKIELIAVLKEDTNLTKMALAYDVYFSNKSSYLNIKESD